MATYNFSDVINVRHFGDDIKQVRVQGDIIWSSTLLLNPTSSSISLDNSTTSTIIKYDIIKTGYVPNLNFDASKIHFEYPTSATIESPYFNGEQLWVPIANLTPGVSYTLICDNGTIYDTEIATGIISKNTQNVNINIADIVRQISISPQGTFTNIDSTVPFNITCNINYTNISTPSSAILNANNITINNNAAITNSVLSSDGLTLTLTVTNMTYSSNYTLTFASGTIICQSINSDVNTILITTKEQAIVDEYVGVMITVGAASPSNTTQTAINNALTAGILKYNSTLTPYEFTTGTTNNRWCIAYIKGDNAANWDLRQYNGLSSTWQSLSSRVTGTCTINGQIYTYIAHQTTSSGMYHRFAPASNGFVSAPGQPIV